MKLNPVRLYLLVFLLFLNNDLVRAQGFVWAKSFACLNSDEAMHTVTDAAGNVYFNGIYHCDNVNIGGIGFNSPESGNSYLAKYTNSGNLIWVKYGINSSSTPYGLAIDDQANIYIAGAFNTPYVKFGNDSLPNSGGNTGNTNFYIVKYDSSGSVLWAENFGGNRDDNAKAIATDHFGNIYLTGIMLSDSLSIDTITLYNPGIYNFTPMVMKFDGNGHPLWARCIRSSNMAVADAYAIATDAGTGVYVSGVFRTDTLFVGEDTLVNSGINSSTANLYFAKYDSAGNPLWAKKAASTTQYSSVDGRSIVSDDFANIYVGGSFTNTTRFDTTALISSGQRDIFVAKYDSSGNLLWAKGKGSSEDDAIWSLALDVQGNCFASGNFKGGFYFASTYIYNAYTGNSDFFILEYSPAGDELLGARAGGLASDYSSSIALDYAGNVFLAGSFDSFSIQLGSTTLTNTYTSTATVGDVIMAKFSYPGVGITENNSTRIQVNLAPNPVRESLQFNVKLPAASDITLQLMNSFGQILFEKQISKQAAGEYTEEIETRTLSSGIYFVNVSTENGRCTRRVVKL